MDAFLYTAEAFYDVVVSQIQRIGCQNDDRTTLSHSSSGQSRPWFAE